MKKLMAESRTAQSTAINKHSTQIVSVYSETILLTLHKTTYTQLFAPERDFKIIVQNNNSECNTNPRTTERLMIFTRLSSLLATMEAKRLSPANSEMRKMYSGAVT